MYTHTHHYATHQDTHWGLSRDETQALVISCLQKPYVIWPQVLSQKPGLFYTNVDPQHISSPILIIVSNWKTAFNLAKKRTTFYKKVFQSVQAQIFLFLISAQRARRDKNLFIIYLLVYGVSYWPQTYYTSQDDLELWPLTLLLSNAVSQVFTAMAYGDEPRALCMRCKHSTSARHIYL